MKVAIATQSDNRNSKISLVFARSKYFAIYNTSDDTIEFEYNQFHNDTWKVADNVSWMLHRIDVKRIVAYELGLKMQDEASSHKTQIVLIPQKIKSLEEILGLMSSRVKIKETNIKK